MERDLVEQGSPAVRPRTSPAPVATSGHAAGILGLPRAAGNAAVTSLVGGGRGADTGAVVQREGLDDLFGPSPFGGGGPEQQGPTDGDGGGSPGAGPTTGEPSGGINELGPVARTGTLIADSIIASSYTPGAGNVV